MQNKKFIKDDPHLRIDQDLYNTLPYLCDSFTNDHKGLHVVFSGCSMTSGFALEKEDTWAYRVYSQLNCSGYYNIAVPGNSISTICLDLIRYCKKYGNPDAILISLPNTDREQWITSEESDEINSYVAYSHYFMLDQYCKQSGIVLVAARSNFNQFEPPFSYLEGFESYKNIEINDFLENVYDYQQKNKKLKNIMTASDGQHQGIAYHVSLSKYMFEFLQQSLNKGSLV